MMTEQMSLTVAGSRLAGLYASMRERLQSAGLGLVDQALTGARQFVVLLIASFLMSKEAFADFAIINVASLLLTQLPNYVIRLPMLVLAGSTFSKDQDNYISYIRWLDAGLSMGAGLLVGAYLYVRFERIGAVPIFLFIGMCLATNMLEINRRGLYMARRADIACRGSLVALITASGGLAVVHLWLPLNLALALAIQVLSICAGVALCWRGPFFPQRSQVVTFRNIVLAHQPYAGWELLGGTLLWSSTNGLILFGAKLLTAEEIGAFRLLTSLCGLITLPVLVTEMLLTTRASERFYRQGRAGLAQWLHAMDAQLGRLLIPYLLLTTISCWIFVRVVFSSKYPDSRFMLPIFIAHMSLTILPATRSIALRAMTLQRVVCASELGRGVTCLAFCVLAFALHSALALISAVAFGSLAFLVGQWRSTERELLSR